MSALFRVQRLLVLPILLAAVLVITTWIAAPPSDAASKREKKIHVATQIAKKQKGDPYVYGAEGPNAFDCSGLIYYSYKKVGIHLARSSDGLYRQLRGIRKQNIRKGDLMFFHSGGNVYHVGIFVDWEAGRRVILHAPNSGEKVHRERVWTGSWKAATLRNKR